MAWRKKGDEKPSKEKQPTREELEKQLEELKKEKKQLDQEELETEAASEEPLEKGESETEKIDQPNKLEIFDMIQGHLARASKLLEYYSSLA